MRSDGTSFRKVRANRWQRPEIHDPLGGPEQKQTWKRFRTHSRTTGRVTCTLCSLYIDINHDESQLPTGINTIKLHETENGDWNRRDVDIKRNATSQRIAA